MNARVTLILLILLSVSLNALAQVLLRLGARSGFQPTPGNLIHRILEIVVRPGLIGGLACYALSVVVWIYVLSRVDVSYAYPFLGLGFVLVALASYLFLGEPLTLQRGVGTILVAAGVLVIARS